MHAHIMDTNMQRCREVLMPLLTRDDDADAKNWLMRETQPLTSKADS